MKIQEMFENFEKSYAEIKDTLQEAIDEVANEEEQDDYNDSFDIQYN